MLLIGFVLLALFSGGFHHHWFFFGPLLCVFPFVVFGGLAAMFMMHMRHQYGPYPRHKHGDWFSGEKAKRQDGSDSDIFYV